MITWKYFKRTMIALFIIILMGTGIPFITFVIFHYFIITPERLTQQIVREINNKTNLLFECKKIELNYLDSWPSISISIHEGNIHIPCQEDADSISDMFKVKFKKAFGSIQFVKLLKEQTLCIEDISIEQPDVFIALDQKFPSLIKDKTGKNNKIQFDINQINVSNAHINFKHFKKNIETQTNLSSILLKGNMAAKEPTLYIEAICPSFINKGKTALFEKDTISINLQGYCNIKRKFKDIYLKDTKLLVNQFPFGINGSLLNLGKNNIPYIDLQFGLEASSLKDLLEFVPEKYLPEKNTYLITGNTELKGEIKGKLKGNRPDWKIEGYINQGSFFKKGIKQGIDSISLDLKACYQENNPDSCFISLNNIHIKGLNSYIQMNSHINNLKNEPFITADLKGNIDFDRIGNEFISVEQATLRGKMETDLSVAFNLKDLKAKRFNRIWADGMIKTQFMEIHSPHYHLDTYISGLGMQIGYKKNKSDFIDQAEILSGTADIDSLKITYSKDIDINLSKLHLRSNTALSQDTSKAIPVTAHLNCANIQAKTNKSNWVSAEKIELHVGTKPSSINIKELEGALVLKAETLKYLDTHHQNAIVFTQSNFITEARPKKKKIKEASKWNIKGLLDFKHAQVYSSYFPSIINLEQTRIGFENDQLILNRLKVKSGESDCMLSGMLRIEPSTDNKSKQLAGNIQILSGNINYDELKQTYLYGEAQLRTSQKTNNPIITLDNMEQLLKPKNKTKIQEHPLYIPKNICLDIQMDIEHMNYREIDLQKLSGNMMIENQQIYSNLSAHTNLGKIGLSLLYDSRKKEQVKACFDLNLQDMLVGQVHRVFPSIGTLIPLTKSMDGLVDCHITAEGLLDDHMLPVLKGTKAACSLHGQNLTLMDNKTFQELARKLRFKSKNKNIIDNLSTNLILQNNQIKIIPSLIEWDRYQAVVGGTHSIDMSFNYHITVLKSPIPLDFGINLTGTPEHFQYKIGRCRFKELYKDGGVEHKKKTDMQIQTFRNEINQKIKPLPLLELNN